MKILVTGTAGFIGHHLALKLVSMNHMVVGLDSINDYYDVNLKYDRLLQQGFEKEKISYGELIRSGDKLEFIQLLLEDKEKLDHLFREEEFDVVINLAAQAGVRYSLSRPDVYVDSNITGFLNILEACRHNNVKHLIYASSSSVYGLDKQIPFSESQHTDHPISMYAATKKANELMAHTYSHLFGLPTTGLRFFTVYGPWGRPDMALFIFTKSILEEKPMEVFNNGNMERDFTYVDDIVESISRLTEKTAEASVNFDPVKPDPSMSSAPFRIFNIGNNSPVKLLDFIKFIEEKTGKKAKMDFLPMQAGDVSKTFADTSKLSEITGFKPYTPVKEGVSRFVDWFRSYYRM